MWIVRGLSHSANIGNMFLQRNNIAIAPGKNLYLPNGKKIPMIATMKASASAEPTSDMNGCKLKASAMMAEPTSDTTGCDLKASVMMTEPAFDQIGCKRTTAEDVQMTHGWKLPYSTPLGGQQQV